MIFRSIKITGKKDLSVSIPETWDDVTYKQLSLIYNETDTLKRISVLTNIPIDLFSEYPELVDFYVWVEDKLAFSNEWDNNEGIESVVFNLDSEVFHFPKDIGVLSIGLYEDMKQEARDNKDNITAIYPLICASYYQTIKDGTYDYQKALELVSLFEGQPCKKVYDAAGFFLSKVNVLKSGTKTGLKVRAIRTIKYLLGSIGFRKYSGLKLYALN